MRRGSWRALFTLGLATHLASAAEVPGNLEQRSKEVAALIAPDAKWADDLFDAAFLAAVPPEKVRAIGAELHRQCGKVEAMQLVERSSELSGKYEAVMEQGCVMPVTVGLTATPPHAVVGLWFGPPAPGLADLQAVTQELGRLGGAVSFGVYRITEKELVPIAEKDAERVLAIGSAFKLYVLGALAREVEQGRRHLEDIVRLEARWRSLPTGKLQQWPLGSPLTLQALAALMISESDNTATDHLLFTLGRGKVEALLPEMGNSAAARNVPFLSTGEVFRLKLAPGAKGCEAYASRDAAGRRLYLEQEVAQLALDPERIDAATLLRPTCIDAIEWFASARDLCKAMQWLERATASPKTAPLREILAINPGLDVPRQAFPFVGFKGGSEAGVLDLTFLLRSKAGGSYALSAGWNDPQAPLDEARFFGLVTRALNLLAKEIERPAAPQ